VGTPGNRDAATPAAEGPSAWIRPRTGTLSTARACCTLRLEQPQPVVLGEVLEILQVEGGQRQLVAKQQAATHVSLTGRGRPRWMASADRPPQIAAMALLPGMTGLSASQLSSIARLRGPQWRSLVHWASSPTVTKVTIGCVPTKRAASRGGSRSRNDRDATSVSRTTASAGGSGKVRVPGLGHERQECVKFLIGLERAVAQLAD
jgi:hypothetical protein